MTVRRKLIQYLYEVYKEYISFRLEAIVQLTININLHKAL